MVGSIPLEWDILLRRYQAIQVVPLGCEMGDHAHVWTVVFPFAGEMKLCNWHSMIVVKLRGDALQ